MAKDYAGIVRVADVWGLKDSWKNKEEKVVRKINMIDADVADDNYRSKIWKKALVWLITIS